MYFPISELHGWGKRFAVQPQTIYSEFLKNIIPKNTAICNRKDGNNCHPRRKKAPTAKAVGAVG